MILISHLRREGRYVDIITFGSSEADINWEVFCSFCDDRFIWKLSNCHGLKSVPDVLLAYARWRLTGYVDKGYPRKDHESNGILEPKSLLLASTLF